MIVERNSDAGITANVAASVNLVEDGARILNWSWGIHRIGTVDVEGEPVDSLLRSGIAMSGYEELLEEFFLWLRREHPDVLVINSAGNGSAHSGRDDYRLPSSFITEQLLVVGGHERNDKKDVSVEHPDYVRKRKSSMSTCVWTSPPRPVRAPPRSIRSSAVTCTAALPTPHRW